MTSPERPFTGQVALITGGASGMARATALLLAAGGADIAIIDLDGPGMDSAAQEIGPERTLQLLADLASPLALEAAVEATMQRFGRIDFLLNVAAYRAPVDRLAEVNPETWAKTYAINVIGPARLTELVGRHMIAAGNGGRIVNVSSSSAFRATGNPPAAYSCSKAAIVQLTRIAAADFGPHNINVNAVVPGATRTAMAERAGMTEKLEQIVKEGPLANLLGRVSLPGDVAALIHFLCLPESRQITGQALHVSAGLIV